MVQVGVEQVVERRRQVRPNGHRRQATSWACRAHPSFGRAGVQRLPRDLGAPRRGDRNRGTSTSFLSSWKRRRTGRIRPPDAGVGTVSIDGVSVFGVAVTYEGGTLTVTIHGELDMATGPELQERLGRLVADGLLDRRPLGVVVDLGNMSFVDCAGTTAIEASLHCLPVDCRITLRSPRPLARRVFEFVGLDGRWVIEDADGPMAALPALRASGDGLVVNVSSAIALFGLPFYATYAAAKAGVANFGDALRRGLFGEGVHVLNVYPGATATPMMESSDGGPALGFDRESPDNVAAATVAAMVDGSITVIRGDETRSQMIALNRDDPQRSTGLLPSARANSRRRSPATPVLSAKRKPLRPSM